MTGFVETDWYHRPLFAVIESPTFEGRTLMVGPEIDLVQLHFALTLSRHDIVVEHATRETPEDLRYEKRWKTAARRLVRAGHCLSAPRTGIGSISMECLHCRMSVTEAAEGEIPSAHQAPQLFVGTYRAQQRSRRKRRGTQRQS
jgi:hypothetical protein